MVKSTDFSPNKKRRKAKKGNDRGGDSGRQNHSNGNSNFTRLASIGKASSGIIKELFNPVEAANRFLNLALHNLEEDSQGRQFILESKAGLRRMSMLLKRLNAYAKKMEGEMRRAIESSKGGNLHE